MQAHLKRSEERQSEAPHGSDHATAKERGDELKSEMDELLDEIDEVLEENANEFVKSYVQKGGE